MVPVTGTAVAARTESKLSANFPLFLIPEKDELEEITCVGKSIRYTFYIRVIPNLCLGFDAYYRIHGR